MAGGRASEALAAYFGRGFVHVGENKPQTMEALIAKWAETGARAPGETRLILAGERADVRALNIEARRHLQNEGVLEKGQKIPTSHGPREFALGDRLVCTRNSKLYGVKNGHLGTVEAIDGRAGKAVLQVRLDGDGRRVSLPVKEYPHVDHGYAITTHKAQGATVDHSFILAGGQLADRELGLVQLSRHRKSAHLFADSSLYRDARLAHHLKPPAPSAPSDSAKPLPWLAPQPCLSSTHQTPPPATRLRETMEALAAELQVSHQKDTTQDYGRSRLQDREQELE
jgi:ATP-dependent exoDNAse (exonuclease V) alpha subunit